MQFTAQETAKVLSKFLKSFGYDNAAKLALTSDYQEPKRNDANRQC